MCPTSTLESCGNSSKLKRLRIRPIGLARGSSLSLKKILVMSCLYLSGPLAGSAPSNIDRNLYPKKGSPPLPTTFQRKKMGPGEVNLMRIEIRANSGKRTTSPVAATSMSKPRFAAICQAGGRRCVESNRVSFVSSVFSNIASTEPVRQNTFHEQGSNKPRQCHKIAFQLTTWLFDSTEDPFESCCSNPVRTVKFDPSKHVQRASNADHHRHTEGAAVSSHPVFLLGRTHSNKQHVGSARTDVRSNFFRLALSEITVMRSSDCDARVLLVQSGQHVLEARRARSQKKDAKASLCSQRQEGLCQVVIANVCLERVAAPTRSFGNNLFR